MAHKELIADLQQKGDPVCLVKKDKDIQAITDGVYQSI